MKPLHLAAIAAVSLFTLSACGKDQNGVAGGSGQNALLAYVPNGSPYLGGNLAPIPGEVIDSYMQKLEPVLAITQTELAKLQQQLQSSDHSDEVAVQLAVAMLQELDGKLNRAGLESLGFDLQANHVFYGTGVFPTVRLGLGDANALKETVQRVLNQAGIHTPEKELQGQKYWQIPFSDDDLDADGKDSEFPIGLYVAILADHIAVSVFPGTVEAEFLPAFLGLEKPVSSDAESRLKAVQAKYGYAPYLAALTDLPALADEFLNPDSIVAHSGGDWYSAKLGELGVECRKEIRGIFTHLPRMIVGSTELTDTAIGMQYVAETQPKEALKLMGLVPAIPAVPELSSRILELSFGMKVGAVRDYLIEKASAISSAPYQCEKLQELNLRAVEAVEQLNQPMPPFVNNFRGVRLSLDSLTMSATIPEEVSGLLAVHVDQPEMFVGMAQMFLPDLAGLGMVKGDPPVQLPPSLIPLPDTVAFAALGDTAIGLSVGAGEESRLPDFLNQPALTDGTFFSVNYDSAAYLDLTDSMSDKWNVGDDDSDHEMPSDVARKMKATELTEAIRNAYQNILDRSIMSVKFTEDGLVIDSEMTFK